MGRLFQILALLILLVNPATGFFQSSSFAFKSFTIEDGLSQNSVIDIAQDHTGFIWLATQDGLNRFDGTNFLVFPKAFDDITTPVGSRLGQIVVDGDRLWLITTGGKLEVMDIRTQKFYKVTRAKDQEGVLPSINTLLVDLEGRIWLGSLGEGVIVLDSDFQEIRRFPGAQEDHSFLKEKVIHQIYQDQKGMFWILTDNGVSYGLTGEGSVFLEGIRTSSIVDDRTGRIWLGSFGNGLFIIDLSEREILHFLPDGRDPYSIGFQDILSIKPDMNGGIWIGTDGGRVSFFNRNISNFGRLMHHNVPEEMAIEQIRSVAPDKKGVVWIGTSGNGITAYDPVSKTFKGFHLKPFHQGINNYDRVHALYPDGEEDLLIGTHGNGLLIMNIRTARIKKWFHSMATEEKQRIPDNTIWCCLKEDDDRVWIGTRNAGILLFDKKEGVQQTFLSGKEDSANNVLSLARISMILSLP